MKAKVKKIFFYTKWLAGFSLKTIVAIIVSPFQKKENYKNLWLISERPDEARDNGYWLYKHIVENHPEINIRYVLSKSSPDYGKLPCKQNVIEPKSFAHYMAFVKCEKAIATEMHGASPGKAFCVPFLPFMKKKQNVFIQHGVIKDSLNIRKKIDIMIASSDQEKDLILSNNTHLKNKVFVAGLCRYDQLKDSSKDQAEKIILIMPTFRKWLRDVSRLKNATAEFQKTEFFKKWNGLLNNQAFTDFVEAKNLRVVFYLHHELQPLRNAFSTKTDRISIAKQSTHDVQDLLKSSSLLITDYSSVFFDFAYMKKPIIYYQFDQGDFFGGHYQSTPENYFLGDRTTKLDDLLRAIETSASAEFAMGSKYSQSVETFFKYHDNRNTERNCRLILSGGASYED